MTRKWIKLHCYERLHGSVSYQLSEAEQSVWDKLLCLAGLSPHDGVISDNDLRAYPHSFIIHELHTTEKLFESLLAKCLKEGRITEDEQGLHITNWWKYQSEYKRQSQYRQYEGKPKSAPEITTYTQKMFETDDDYIESLLTGEDKGKEKTRIYTCTVFKAKYGQEKAAEYWPQYLLYLERE